MKSLASKLNEIQDDLDAMFQEVQVMLQAISDGLKQTASPSERQQLYDRLSAGDDKVDSLDIQIEERCMMFLALQQPVAVDLRKIIAVSRIIVHLERIADICVNVSNRLRALSPDNPELPPLLIEMAELASKMLTGVISANRQSDVSEAERIRAEDDIMDRMQSRSIDEIMKKMVQEKSNVDDLLNLFSITRQLERIADHIVGVSEEIIFFVEGRIVRHESKTT